MHQKETEVREVALSSPFVPFTLITASGERYKFPAADHISFFPDSDEDDVRIPDEERAQSFIICGRGSRHRLLFFIGISAVDIGRTPFD
jgi:hypothetical protein